MKVRSLHIDAFGGLADTGLESLPRGLVVLYGPNEAGKSTLLAFLRGALFGFPGGNTSEPRYLPPNERRRSGRVELEQDGRVLVVERSAPPPGKRKLAVRYGDGAEAAAEDLTRWLGHADAELYKNVFAFSLSELQGFESLGTSGIQERIFSAGITGAGRSAREALKQLDDRAHALLSSGGRKGRILELVAERHELRAVLDRQREAAQSYAALAAREQQCGAELAVLRESVEEHRREKARADKLVELWRDVWSPLQNACEQLAKLEETAGFPDDAKDKLKELHGAIGHFEERVDHDRSEVGACDRQIELLVPDLALEAVAAEVVELESERAAHRERLVRCAGLQRDVHDRAMRLQLVARDELGSAFDDERIAHFDASHARAAEAHVLRDRLLAVAAAEAAAQTRAEQRAEEEARIELRRQRTADRRDGIDVDPIEDLDERGLALRGLRSERGERRAEERVCIEREAMLEAILPPRARGWLSAAAAAGLLAILAGGLVLLAGGGEPELGTRLREGLASLAPAIAELAARGLEAWPRLPAAVALAAAALGLLGLAIAIAGRRRYGRELSRGEEAVAVVRQQLVARDRRLAALASPFAIDGVPDEAALDRLELELRRERDRAAERDGHASSVRGYEEELATLRADRERLQPEIDRLRVEREHAEEEARGWRAEHGVPAGMPMDQVPLLFETLRRARQLLEARRDASEALARVDEQIEVWEAAARSALERSGTPDAAAAAAETGEALATRLRELAEGCSEDARRRAERGPLLERRRQARESLEKSERRLAAKHAELHTLLREGGATSEAEFRARLAVAEQRAALEREVDRCELELERRLGLGDEAQALRSELELGQVTQWEERAERAGLQVCELEEGRDEAVRAHRDLVNEVKDLGDSAAVAEGELALAQSAEELTRDVEEWRRLRLARGLVRETLARFERERQPAVLRDASELFARITAGRYARVEQSAAENGSEAFVVVDAEGRRHALGDLSRGTAEQLYLCVRLGLIEEFARRSVSLPVAMDDVLVNFDDARARSTAAVLGEFAAREERQLLFFTCSEATRDRLLESAPGATTIDLGTLR